MVTAKATTWVMVMVTRLAGNKEGKGEGGKGNADDDGNSDGSGDKVLFSIVGKFDTVIVDFAVALSQHVDASSGGTEAFAKVSTEMLF